MNNCNDDNIKNLNIFVICSKEKEPKLYSNCEKQFNSIGLKKKFNIHYYRYI